MNAGCAFIGFNKYIIINTLKQLFKAVGTVLRWGEVQKKLRTIFLISHEHIERMQFCSIAYL